MNYYSTSGGKGAYPTSPDAIAGGRGVYNLPLYPDYIKPVSNVRPTRRVINSVATTAQERQLMVAADGAVIPLIYGRQRVGAKIAVITEDNGFFYVLAVFALGECDSIESILFDGDEQATWIVAEYLGTTSQTADSTLAGLISGYDDDLVMSRNGTDIGICNAVLKIPADEFPSSIEAIIEGQKVYDPRTTTTVYSANPALCLADFKSNDVYGQGLTPDWDSVEAVADDNDELVGLNKRREINIAIDKMADISKHIEAMRVYAGCFVLQEDVFYLVSDRPASVSRALTASDIIDGSLTIKKSGTAKLPTLMTVVYTDTTSEPWKDSRATAEYSGLVERRESIVNLQGITTYTQAMREAIERLNALHLSDLIVEFTSFDESLADQVGDVITVSHPKGLTTKKLRILAVNQTSAGRYKITGAEYDELVYSNNLESEPTYPDTTLPSPGAPTPVTGLSAVEELFQQNTGAYASRLRISWTAPAYPYVAYYRVVVTVGATIVYETNTVNTVAVTNAVLELAQHDIDVYVFSGLAFSTEASTNVTPLGKYLAPSDVATLSGFEAGGTVYLQWGAAIDIDIWRYEVRYGTTGSTWETSTLIDRTDSLRLTTDEIAAGTWKFYVKALDSVSNYSDTAATKTLTVTIDTDAFLVGENQFDSPSYTLMHEYQLERGGSPVYAVSESTETWNALFPNAMSTYTNSIFSYQSDITSEYLSETWDVGLELSGDWAAEVDITTISGTITSQMELSTDNFVADTQVFTDLSAKATARYARLRVGSGTGLFLAEMPDMLVRINAIPRAENGEDTSSATKGTIITLDNTYSAAKLINVTPIGTTAISYAIDNVMYGDTLVLNGTFDTATTNWTAGNSATISIDSGRLKITNGDTLNGKATQTITLPAGDYVASVDYDHNSSNTVSRIKIGTTDGGGEVLNTDTGTLSTTATGTITGTFTLASETTVYLLHNIQSTATTGLYDNSIIRREGGGQTFDVYLFDNDGTQIANDFIWKFEGV